MVLLAPEQATEATHRSPMVRASRQKPCDGAAAVSMVPVVLGRRRVVMPVAAVVAMAGLLLALDLVLDRIGHRDAGSPAQERLQLAPVAHLVPNGATCTTADHRCHEALLAVLRLPWLAVIV